MTDCIIVGAGPAGLATSAALSRYGVEHMVLERAVLAKPGEASAGIHFG